MSALNFRYYEHGVHCGNFVFDGPKIEASLLDRLTGAWSETSAFGSVAEPGAFPFGDVLPTFEAFAKAYRGGEEVALPDGRVYRRYRECGVGGTVLWALVTAGPMLDLVFDPSEKALRGALWTSRHGAAVLVEAGWESATPLTLWDDPTLPPASTVRRLETEYVPMRDGVRLATEVWLPKGTGGEGKRYPAVLMRTPYNRTVYGKMMMYLAERGYALVSQDVRGREDSEGEFSPSLTEMPDGKDTLDWLEKQPWCDGSVGMIGPSYLGNVQWQAAATGHPALKALVSQVTSGGPFVDTPRPEGTCLSGFFAWMFMMSERRVNRSKMHRSDWPELLRTRPLRDIPEKALGYKLPFWEEWVKHPDYDDFWRRSDWALHGDSIDVPALLISDWYDDDNRGTAQAWAMNAARGRKHQKMILGPWLHNYNTTRCIHRVPLGVEALRYDLDVLALRWFERFLKGVENGVDARPAVEYYQGGANEWREASAWPPCEASPTPFYLHSGGGANGSAGDGALSFDAPGAEPEDTYVYDPENPVPHLIDLAENEMNVPENYKDVEKRGDVLVYTSHPMTGPLAVTGEITAMLYAASDAPDTDWLVRVTDLDEEGNSIRLTDRIIRAICRDSCASPKPLTPGEFVRYEIRMPFVAHTFLTGHRVRVQVTSSAANLVFPNPNTGGNLFEETEVRVAHQRVRHDREAPSHVLLPVAERDTERP